MLESCINKKYLYNKMWHSFRVRQGIEFSVKNNTLPIVSEMRNTVIPLLFCVVNIAALGRKANAPLRKIYAAGKPLKLVTDVATTTGRESVVIRLSQANITQQSTRKLLQL
jgi:hypothetical protein